MICAVPAIPQDFSQNDEQVPSTECSRMPLLLRLEILLPLPDRNDLQNLEARLRKNPVEKDIFDLWTFVADLCDGQPKPSQKAGSQENYCMVPTSLVTCIVTEMGLRRADGALQKKSPNPARFSRLRVQKAFLYEKVLKSSIFTVRVLQFGLRYVVGAELLFVDKQRLAWDGA